MNPVSLLPHLVFSIGLFHVTIIFDTGTQGFRVTPYGKHWFWHLGTRTVYSFIV